jgi:diaminopimelate epimerase
MDKNQIFLEFTKMHGLGNDFVILDFRENPSLKAFLTPSILRHIADRRQGVGCDQVVVMMEAESSSAPDPDTAPARAHLSFYNRDGSESAACGNGTRCAASLLMTGKADAVICQTNGGILEARKGKKGDIQVNMGAPRLEWSAIPLAYEVETDQIPIELSRLHHSGEGLGQIGFAQAVNMGNPHLIFFVSQLDRVDLSLFGPLLEHHVLFPQRTNVSFAQVMNPSTISLRVWERGTGLTPACGSGACAVAVAAFRRGLTHAQVVVDQPGGSLEIEWDQGTSHVIMSGPVAHTFTGSFLLEPARGSI